MANYTHPTKRDKSYTHEVTRHANGKLKTETIRYCLNKKWYETIRFFSTSGVFFNWMDRPVS